jgi:hypothetical protein
MTTPNLRERVARAIEESLYGTERIGRTDILQYGLEADAAIAIVLEEAAKVAENYDGPGIVGGYDRHLGDGYETRRDIAAAIRVLKEKP